MTAYIRSKPECKFSEPNSRWCPPLKDNIGHYGTPEGFYKWHASIWEYKVNPSNFGPDIFHPGCLLTDPFATLCGPLHSSIYFQLLFGFFPDLSGKHIRLASTDNEIFILWGFLTTKGRQEILVPASDVFGLKNGLINYRLATFDIATLVHALVIAYGGSDPIFEGNLAETIWRWHVDEDFAKSQLALLQARPAPIPRDS